MKKFLLCASICLFAFQAVANDGVVVNANVLNSLTNTSIAPAPKFPIMPKRIAKPKVIKKAKPVVAIAPKPVVAKPSVASAPKPTTVSTPKPALSTQQIKEQQDLQKQFEAMPTVAKAPAPSKEPQKENIFDAYNKPKTLELMPGAKVTDIPAPKPQSQATPISGQIKFESFEAKLSDANKTKIDEIVATYKDPINNKISIIAYNVEDGADAFKKKRQVLDHALEIRNYLAQKGYNNISLRVLSVKGDANKTNLVEISEL